MHDDFSPLRAVRALHEQVQARLEASEDFRVARLLDFVIMREARLPRAGAPFDPEQPAEGEPSSALAAVSALRDKIRARFEGSEDYRVFSGLAALLADQGPPNGERLEIRTEVRIDEAQTAPVLRNAEPDALEDPARLDQLLTAIRERAAS